MVIIDELHARCIYELWTHEQYYKTIKTEMHLDRVDDDSVQDHVVRILNNHQYNSVLMLAALSTVIQQPIESIYSSVNDNDDYCKLLNIIFILQNTELSLVETSVRIMWSGPKEKVDRIWRANHFVPALAIDKSMSSIKAVSSIQTIDNNIKRIEAD